MKNLVLITPFVFAFLFVSGMLVYLNTIYNNIFQFDFSPKLDNQILTSTDSLAVKDSINIITKSEIDLASDKQNKADTVSYINNLGQIDKSLNNTDSSKLLNLTEKKSPQENIVEKTNKDSAYSAWLKKTVKLVENLSPAQASKLLKNYSDNQARDILYAMKQKKAAKIISYLEPEYVHKLTRFQ